MCSSDLILRSGSTIDEHAIFIENLTPTQFVVETTTVPEPIKSNLSNAYYDEKTMPEDEQKNDLLALDTGSYKDELKDKEHRIILETLARCHDAAQGDAL